MPRKRKTLPAETPSLEAGASYGQVGENLAAQNPAQGGIPLPDRSAPPGVSPPPPLPVEQATSFTPGITPLTSPGTGKRLPREIPAVTNTARSARLLQQWAQTTNDPRIAEAARRMEFNG